MAARKKAKREQTPEERATFLAAEDAAQAVYDRAARGEGQATAQIDVENGEIIVRTSDMPAGTWHVFDRGTSRLIAAKVLA